MPIAGIYKAICRTLFLQIRNLTAFNKRTAICNTFYSNLLTGDRIHHAKGSRRNRIRRFSGMACHRL